jgi:predicted phosphodiesterase
MKTFLTILISACFLLAAGQTPVLRFGVVTDIHNADIPDAGARTYRQSPEKLKEFVDTMNRYKPDFIIELGDFKDMSQPISEEKTLGYLRQTESVYSCFAGPRYHVLGNHDEDCISKDQFYSVASNTGISKAKTFYSFTRNGVHFIVLDACFDSAGRGYSKGNFKWSDSNIPLKEQVWLKKDLKKARNPVIVFVHQLLDGNGEAYYVRNAAAIRQILEESQKVKAVFQGHYHEGKYTMMNGIHYYTLKSLIEGKYPEGNSYAVVELQQDGSLKIRGFRKAEAMILK